MDGSLRITPDIEIPLTALTWRFSRSSGPGGQSVNTSDSRVELIFDLEHSDAFPPELHARAVQRLNKEMVDGGVVVTSSRYRSQLSNRDDAQRKFVKLLQGAIAPPPPKRRKTRPSKSATQKPLGRQGSSQRNQKNAAQT